MMRGISPDVVKRRCFLISFSALLLSVFTLVPSTSFLRNASILLPSCSVPTTTTLNRQYATALLHYATTQVTPQQSRQEIGLTLDVLLARGRPCNFLIFGLGHDSLMWAAFNPGGTTLFLEEDPKWVHTVLSGAPNLVAKAVKYSTQLKQADELLRTYKEEPFCLPAKAFVQGNSRCRLALADLPNEVYAREWDVIMIDAPRGYFPEAPGRMAAIWSAAVMARNRMGEGPTDVFLHDVNRKVEKEFALEFLCKKHLVKGVQRLWHFRIPSVNSTGAGADSVTFC